MSNNIIEPKILRLKKVLIVGNFRLFAASITIHNNVSHEVEVENNNKMLLKIFSRHIVFTIFKPKYEFYNVCWCLHFDGRDTTESCWHYRFWWVVRSDTGSCSVQLLSSGHEAVHCTVEQSVLIISFLHFYWTSNVMQLDRK